MKRIATIGILTATLAIGTMGGVYLGSVGFGTSAPADAQANSAGQLFTDPMEPVTLKTNSSGQLYGPLDQDAVVDRLNGNSDPAQPLPDLVLVIGDSGREGYVDVSVFVTDPQELPSSPDEAVALTREQQKSTTHPVYEADGVTQIDTFTISPGASATE